MVSVGRIPWTSSMGTFAISRMIRQFFLFWHGGFGGLSADFGGDGDGLSIGDGLSDGADWSAVVGAGQSLHPIETCK